MAPEVVIPYDTLISIGTELKTVSDGITGDKRAAYDVNGLDDPGQGDINSAIGDFRDEWKASVEKLGENIGTFGDISQQIGTTVQAFDVQTGNALRPPSGAPSAPGGGHPAAV